MKSQRHNMRLSMLMMTAGAASLAACAMPADPDKEAASDQSVPAANEQTPDESAAAANNSGNEQTPDESTTAAKASASEVTPRVSCRLVVVSSIPVFTTPTSNVVRCRFPLNTRFSHFGAAGNRWITWCPLGVPPSQGTTSFAQNAGTIDGGCG